MDEITNNKTPSIQYFLFNGKRIIKQFSSGYADIIEKRKVDSNTSYHAFSVTKTFTALAVLQLAEKGMIELDTPIVEHLSGFPYNDNITIRQLLSHSSGIPNPIPLSWIHLKTEHENFDRVKFVKNIFDKHNKTKSGANETFSYSNLGYIILGQLIEKCSGESYENYITKNIIDLIPLNPGDLSFKISDESVHAKGYQKKWSLLNFILGFFIDKSKFMGKTEGKWKPFNCYYVNGPSYGGLIGKPMAFVKYIQEYLRTDSPLISADIKQSLFLENKVEKSGYSGMCLSWFKGQLNGKTFYTHAGGGGGYYCELRIYPEMDLGSVIFFNRTGTRDERYLDKLDRKYLNE